VLSKVADALRESIRKNDIAGRIGGDEFLIILPDTDDDNAKMIKKRIMQDAQEKNNKKDYLVSVSIGIATSDEINNRNTDELINLADHRMYEEKQEYYQEKGKNPR
jgi:diguanylate cyclase (GGDEF)-like protein